MKALSGWVGHAIDTPVCFGDVPDRGVKDDAGRFLLHQEADDRLLAARILHLEHHQREAVGSSCRADLLHEEAVGWAAELAHRAHLGVTDPTCPAEEALGSTPTVARVEAWLASSSHPVPSRLRASHATRCRE